jgi:hypothetical protein
VLALADQRDLASEVPVAQIDLVDLPKWITAQIRDELN